MPHLLALRTAVRMLFLASCLALAGASGCKPEPAPPEPAATAVPPPALRVLVVDDPALAQAVQRQWSSRADGEVTVAQESATEFAARDLAQPLGADIIIYPTHCLGALAESERILPLPHESLEQPAYQLRNIFNVVRATQMSWGEQLYAVSFGAPNWILHYRADVFEKLGVVPPESWSEYQKLAERLHQREPLKDLPHISPQWSGTLEPAGERWSVDILLARAAAYARHRGSYSSLFDYRSMEPLIDRPSYVRALEELVAARRWMPADADRLDPAEVCRRLARGEAAMGITWAASWEIDADAGDSENSALSREAIRSLQLAALPGSRDVYSFRDQRWEQRGGEETRQVPLVSFSGRLGSVSQETRHARAALRMLLWLSGEEFSGQVSPASRETGPFRQSHLAAPATWLAPQYSSVAVEQFAEITAAIDDSSTWLGALTIPGRDEYYAELASAVQAACAGKALPEEALRQAAARWRQITERRGLDAQRQAYIRSLGLAP